jgi:hypothetical protein
VEGRHKLEWQAGSNSWSHAAAQAAGQSYVEVTSAVVGTKRKFMRLYRYSVSITLMLLTGKEHVEVDWWCVVYTDEECLIKSSNDDPVI